MALEILAGAAVGQLLEIVLNAKEMTASFQPTLKKLEKTLRDIDRRLVEINHLNEELDISRQEMEDLVAIIKNGNVLVRKCSEISTLNFVKQLKYSKQLLDLDDDLFRYFMTTLSLDHFKNTKMILAMVNQMHQFMGERSDGGISHMISSQSTEKPKEYWRIVVKEVLKMSEENRKEEVVMHIGKDSRMEESVKLSAYSKKEEANLNLSEHSEAAKVSTDSDKEEEPLKLNKYSEGIIIVILMVIYSEAAKVSTDFDKEEEPLKLSQYSNEEEDANLSTDSDKEEEPLKLSQYSNEEEDAKLSTDSNKEEEPLKLIQYSKEEEDEKLSTDFKKEEALVKQNENSREKELVKLRQDSRKEETTTKLSTDSKSEEIPVKLSEVTLKEDADVQVSTNFTKEEEHVKLSQDDSEEEEGANKLFIRNSGKTLRQKIDEGVMRVKLIDGGAIVEFAMGDLLREVNLAIGRFCNFYDILVRIENTIMAMVTVCNLRVLSSKVEQMTNYIANFVGFGQLLSQKCVTISSINLVKKALHSRELREFDEYLMLINRICLTQEGFLAVVEAKESFSKMNRWDPDSFNVQSW